MVDTFPMDTVPPIPDPPKDGREDLMDDVAFIGTSLLMIPHERDCPAGRGAGRCTCTREEILRAWGRLVDLLKDA